MFPISCHLDRCSGLKIANEFDSDSFLLSIISSRGHHENPKLFNFTFYPTLPILPHKHWLFLVRNKLE